MTNKSEQRVRNFLSPLQRLVWSSILLALLLPVLTAVSTSPFGTTALLSVWILINQVYAVTVVLMFFLFCSSAAATSIPMLERPAKSVCILSFAISLAMVAGVFFSASIREVAFRDLDNRTKNLIKAIALFESEHGYTPTKLDELVPEYLAAVPMTGMGIHPNFDFNPYDTKPGNWTLNVPCPMGFFDWRRFEGMNKKDWATLPFWEPNRYCSEGGWEFDNNDHGITSGDHIKPLYFGL